ncbi:MAG: hypothetical protein AMXMBFR84_27110 [Candidatus Hydrogenedentota bacterium]
MSEMFTVYITAPALLDSLFDDDARAEAAALLKKARVGSVVIEGFREGRIVPEDALRAAQRFFQEHGFEVLGGIMPWNGHGFGKGAEGLEARLNTFCFSDEGTVDSLRQEICKLARLFGTVVIDDGFMTSCRCPHCDELRIGREWGAMRRDLLCRVAEQWVKAAHQASLNARIIVKFPQYYDRYARFGYDAQRFPAIFDGVWQGTETRDPATLDYGYVEPYQGYLNYEWMRIHAGEKLEAAWFDHLDCDAQTFQDQAVTSHLCGPRRVVLFSYDKELFSGSWITRLTRSAPALETLRNSWSPPQGVHVIKPLHADGAGDLFLFDYLGMMGIPCVPAHEMSTTHRCTLVTSHGIADARVREAIPRALVAGRHVIATFSALERMAAYPDLLEFFGYRSSGLQRARGAVSHFVINGTRYATDEPFHVAGDLAPSGAAVLSWAEFGEANGQTLRTPFVTAKAYSSGGRAIVWNLGTFGHEAFDIREQLNVPVPSELLGIPKDVLDYLRHTATGPLGFDIKAPSRVASFVFDQSLVFVNYGEQPAEVNVHGLNWESSTLSSNSKNTTTSGHDVYLAPCSYALLRRA